VLSPVSEDLRKQSEEFYRDAPSVADSLRSEQTPECAFRVTDEFARWIFEKYWTHGGQPRLLSDQVGAFMDRMRRSPTVAKLLSIERWQAHLTADRIADALACLLMTLAQSEGQRLREARASSATADDDDLIFPGVPTKQIENLTIGQIEDLISSNPSRSHSPARLYENIRMSLFWRRFTRLQPGRPSTRTPSPLRCVGQAVDHVFGGADRAWRDRLIVALGREIFGVKTTAGRVFELMKADRRTL
jgi:hypothetical protein